MEFRKRPSLTAREIWILTALVALALILVGALLAADVTISGVARGGGEFYGPWSGARRLLWQQTGPYDEGTTASAQQLAYGRPAGSGENPYILSTPYFVLLSYFPFALISTPSAARGLWMCLSQVALIGSAFIVLSLINWRRPRVFIVMYLLLAVFSFYSVAAMQEGTPVIVLGLLYVGILWAYQHQRDELAGALVVLCLFRWEVGGPFLVLFMWRTFHEKRWNILLGFAMALIVLLAIAFLSYPGWVLPFLTATLVTIRASFGVTASSILSRFFPESGSAVAQALAVLVISLLVFEGAAGRNSDFRRFVWIGCLALAAAPLIGLRTEMSNLTVLQPAIALICAASISRGRTGRWLAGIILTIAFVLPWLTFARWSSLQDQKDYDFLFLLYPLLCTAGLYWTRWWFIHPRRTVLEEARSAIN